MPRRIVYRVLLLACLLVSTVVGLSGQVSQEAVPLDNAAKLRDVMWLWALDVDDLQKAQDLGIPNIQRAIGRDLVPLREGEQELLNRSGRVTCEISAGNDFDFTPQLTQVQAWAREFPNIEAVLLDDMSTGKISRGLRADALAGLCHQLQSERRPFSLWGVVYTMSIDPERDQYVANIADYMRYLDMISLWTWQAKDIPKMEENLARCEQLSGGKPVMLGLYLMGVPQDLMEQQCELARQWAQEGRITGMLFLLGPGGDYGADTPILNWWRQWIEQVGDEPL